jgi:hypothetical protein
MIRSTHRPSVSVRKHEIKTIRRSAVDPESFDERSTHLASSHRPYRSMVIFPMLRKDGEVHQITFAMIRNPTTGPPSGTIKHISNDWVAI